MKKINFLSYFFVLLFSTFLWQESTTIENLGRFTFDQTNFCINGSQNFKLSNNYSAELTGFHQTRSLVGNVKFEPLGITDIPKETILIERIFV